MKYTIFDREGNPIHTCGAGTFEGAIQNAVAAGVNLEAAVLDSGCWEIAYGLERERAIAARAELEACKAPVARLETEARRMPPAPVAAPEVSFTFREATADEQAALRVLVAVLYATARTIHARVLSIQGQMCAVNYESVADGYGDDASTSYRVHEVEEKTLEMLTELESLDADLRNSAESGEPCES